MNSEQIQEPEALMDMLDKLENFDLLNISYDGKIGDRWIKCTIVLLQLKNTDLRYLAREIKESEFFESNPYKITIDLRDSHDVIEKDTEPFKLVF